MKKILKFKELNEYANYKENFDENYTSLTEDELWDMVNICSYKVTGIKDVVLWIGTGSSNKG